MSRRLYGSVRFNGQTSAPTCAKEAEMKERLLQDQILKLPTFQLLSETL